MDGARSTAARTLLLVDDEEDILSSIESLVQTFLPGTRVRTALTGPEALEVLRGERVDLVVSDYKMPGMDGLTFLKEAAELAPTAPRLLMSAFASRDLEARAHAEAGAVSLVPKPIDVEAFVTLLGGLLQEPPRSG